MGTEEYEIDDMVTDFKSIIAKQEFQMIKKRLRAGKKAGAMKGNWVNGKAPYGYEYSHKTKKLIPDTTGNPSPVEIVQSVFNDVCKNNMSTSEIAYKLNRKGIYTNSGAYWSNTAISRMLKQEVYLGKTIYGKSSGSGHKNKKTTPLKFKDKSEWIIVNNAHEPIISEEIFEDVQQIMGRSKKVIATRKSKISALSGLIKCKCCGAGMYIQRKPNNKNIIRNCWKKDAFGNKCGNKGIAESKVINRILIEIKKYRDELAQILEQGQGNDKNRDAILKNIADLKKELKQLEAKKDRLDDFLEDGVYTKEKYLSRMDKLTAKEKDAESEIELLNNQLKKQDAVQDKDKIALLDTVLNNFDQVVSEEDKNRVFKSIISHIDLKRLSDDDEGEITVNFL
ncbi:recombinase family protein [Virgibacillus dakarensis]|uniref:recombinase family protein n=1 Tax=Virgibacillus dakarensis TaxID=1917889 RepID=UPI0013563271|nr:recombinase family protein [Virgibacillus dakarensis]